MKHQKCGCPSKLYDAQRRGVWSTDRNCSAATQCPSVLLRRTKPVKVALSPSHGCQMALDLCFRSYCLALRASGLWLRFAALQNLIPSFPWIAHPRPRPRRNPRKGRDQILPSGNTGKRVMAERIRDREQFSSATVAVAVIKPSLDEQWRSC